MRSFRYALLVSTLLLASCVQAAPVSLILRRQDPRLEKPVSCVARHIYVGELIEKLSNQSGVALTADEAGGAADVDVTVSLDHVPLGDAMEALWSLVSYQDAEWDWERIGKEGRYKYRLVQPEAARLLPNTLHDQVDKEVQAQTKNLLDALKMTPDQLKEAAKDDPLLASMADGSKDDRVRPSMNIFADLPPELQDSILQDHTGVVIPLSGLSPRGRRYVHDNWLADRNRGGLTKDEQGNLIPVREPQSISVSCGYSDLKMAPSLNIDTGFGCGDLAGGGWMEKEWRSKVSLLWLRPGDLRDIPAAAKQVPKPQWAGESSSEHTFAERLMQLSRAAPLPLLARLPDERGSNSITSTAPYNQPVRAYLASLQSSLEHKWRNGVLLLSYSPRLTDPGKATDAPWSVVRRLRESEANGDGYLTLNDYARAAHGLTPQQMQALSAHFPSMPNASFWRDVLAIYDGSPSIRPALLSSSGCDYAGVLHAAAAALGPETEKLVQDGTATCVRIEEKRHDELKPAAKEIAILLVSEKGKILAGQGFTYQSHQWVSSVEAAKAGGQGGN